MEMFGRSLSLIFTNKEPPQVWLLAVVVMVSTVVWTTTVSKFLGGVYIDLITSSTVKIYLTSTLESLYSFIDYLAVSTDFIERRF